ncbi:N-acetylmuramoyl-L-alanine amidase [Sediminibacillus massiliensis]|uniref:N-acetylmuramoyl-L-alanine amidase n=1 Tax=Sediminibacillus massiliensis TaxID=1926277 RepID=UPI00098857A0|nr:N-acetylmuramoyl-L-alanine amidase [Sediminibacillus massiliensis]
MKFINYLGSALVFLLILMGTTNLAQASSNEVYTVDASNLLVRDAPAGDAEVLGHLHDGDQVTVFDVENGWAQTYYDNQVAYVAFHYLYSSDTEIQTSLKQEVTVKENGVRVRTGPGTDHTITTYTNEGDSFEVVETKNNWHKLETEDGETGWVASWLTDSKSSEQKRKSQSVGILDGYTIILDPGHGGKDPGAISFDNTYEKDLTLSTAKQVEANLEDKGANVIMTRDSDSYLSLNDRVALSNDQNPDAFISFHFNSFPISTVGGIHTFYHNSNDREFAKSLQSGIAGNVSLEDKGIQQAQYRVLRKNDNLSALVELGFLSNPNDLSVIRSESYNDQVAAGITEGVVNYFAE